MVHQEEFLLETRGHRHMQDITRRVAEAVAGSGIQTGLAQVFNVGSTAAVGTIEFEPGLERDLPELLDRLIPPSRHYGHEQAWHDGNGHSHLQAAWLGPSISVPITNGALVLGTWQQIFHLECDIKPRRRTIVVTVVGELNGEPTTNMERYRWLRV
jgi:secondary thiamine-phosphate synthase enzyme